MKTKEIAEKIKEVMGLNYYPVGVQFTDKKPENAKGFVSKGNGCIMPLIFTAAKGKTVAFDSDTTGWACSAFYLGYQEWIFEGIECYLSDKEVWGRSPERFIETPEKAKKFIESQIPESIRDKAVVFKPLSDFEDGETPELVIFFANPDELSALVYALHYRNPEQEDLVVTRFISGCSSVFTYPMQLKSQGKLKAVWGMHDISVRKRLPKDVMTLTMPFELVTELHDCLDSNFFITEQWKIIKERNQNSVKSDDTLPIAN